MLSRKLKNIALIAGGVIALMMVVLFALWGWPEQRPFDLIPMSVKPLLPANRQSLYWSEELDVGTQEQPAYDAIEFAARQHVSTNHPVPILRETIQACVDNHWVDCPKSVMVRPDRSDGIPSTMEGARFLILVPHGAQACRVEISYPSYRSGFPLGIDNPFMRGNAGGRASQKAQQIVGAVSPRLLNFLWPDLGHVRLETVVLEMRLNDLAASVSSVRIEKKPVDDIVR